MHIVPVGTVLVVSWPPCRWFSSFLGYLLRSLWRPGALLPTSIPAPSGGPPSTIDPATRAW